MKANSFAVLGLGRFGQSLANSLCSMGCEVLAVDPSEECVNRLSPDITQAVVGDITDEALLKSLGIRNYDVAIVAKCDKIETSIMSTLILKEAGVKFVVSRAQSELHARLLSKVGANRVIFPERDMGVRVAHNLVSPNVLDLIELSPDDSILEIIPSNEWIGKNLKESSIREKYGVSIIAVKKSNSIVVAPRADYVIREGDLLVVIGTNDEIKKLEDI